MPHNYNKGLHELGNGQYAWLQPDGNWGYNNAGLVVDGDQSLLVDTLFDEVLTAEMLGAMQRATGIGGDEVTTLVNTHANGDHTYGNGLVRQAEIIASAASAAEMDELPPEAMAELANAAPDMGELGDYFTHCFGDFQFAGINMRAPTRTFSDKLSLQVGDKTVHLLEVGPAHTRGDVLCWVPADKTIYTGDILFIESTPIIWAGPVSNWISACDFILEQELDTIVPGHGPLTDKAGVRAVRDYLQYVYQETRRRFDAGLSAEEAAFDIALGDYSSWGDAERIGVNVNTIYAELDPDFTAPDIMSLFALMARLRNRHLGRHHRL